MTKIQIQKIIRYNYRKLMKYEVISYFDIFMVGRRYISPFSIIKSYFSPYKQVLCTPNCFSRQSVYNRIFALNGYKPVFDSGHSHDFAITVFSRLPVSIINGKFKGNGKTLVATAWESVSGHKLSVDPLEYTGQMVEKSELNSTHDGRILSGPLSRDAIVSGKVYQVLVDNSDGEHVTDLRVAINGNHLTLVYVRRRPVEIRFADTNNQTTIRGADDIFSPDEQHQILACARKLGLDHGEADVLRDQSSGLIYIVDVTHDASVTLAGLTASEDKRAMKLIARDFDRYLTLRWSN